ncbi:hypothetical protein [Planococcus salinus]|uniref:Transposase n=1 Tax=Planococcus salinus TaxID=1848460 RepID=A0A3M8P5B2_9BACL|nr:hypothetical protein [Planococcus salinus]RNF38404.1 hypothetical protein EEX84_14915 [Planococcus salinus]
MRYWQYKGVVEREYKKSLKKVMYELCVEEGLNAAEGAKRLGLAKEVFVYWRNHYRFEKKQILFDETVKDLKHLQSRYEDDVKNVDLKRPLLHEKKQSVEGLEELVERMVEYYKVVHHKSGGLSTETAKLPLYEFSYEVVGEYRNGKLLEKVKEFNES